MDQTLYRQYLCPCQDSNDISLSSSPYVTTDLAVLGFSVTTYSTHLESTSLVSHKYAGHISGKIVIYQFVSVKRKWQKLNHVK
jgi:hypothetical protein